MSNSTATIFWGSELFVPEPLLLLLNAFFSSRATEVALFASSISLTKSSAPSYSNEVMIDSVSGISESERTGKIVWSMSSTSTTLESSKDWKLRAQKLKLE